MIHQVQTQVWRLNVQEKGLTHVSNVVSLVIGLTSVQIVKVVKVVVSTVETHMATQITVLLIQMEERDKMTTRSVIIASKAVTGPAIALSPAKTTKQEP